MLVTGMINKINFLSTGKWLLLCGWLALFLGGVTQYSGSWGIYTAFSLVLLMMLISGFYRQISYGYLFLVVFLWLGFWLKSTVHIILDYPFEEPIGYFSGAPEAWDEVLWVATVAGMAVIMGRILYGSAGRRSTIVFQEGGEGAPTWYFGARKWIWPSFLAITIFLASVNAIYSIQQSGIAARTILPWPFNAAIYWMLSMGLAMGVASLLWWDISLKKDVSLSSYSIHIEGILSSISILSRGIYIFHAVPQMLALYKNRREVQGFSLRKIGFLIIFVLCFFVVALAAVNTLRSYKYSKNLDFSTRSQVIYSRLEVLQGTLPQLQAYIKKGKPLELRDRGADERFEKWIDHKGGSFEQVIQDLNKEMADLKEIQLARKVHLEEMENSRWGLYQMLLEEFGYQIADMADRISHLAVDRWVGLEGVMAVSSYPGKSDPLLLEAAVEKPKIGQATLYQKVCNSHYQNSDTEKYSFASLPGPAAFFYYSGSPWYVFVGILALVLVGMFSESLIQHLTGNALLCGLYGMDVANAIAQFGVAPRQLLIHFFMVWVGVGFICVLQSGIPGRLLSNWRSTIKS
jgi:hypothetical protein